MVRTHRAARAIIKGITEAEVRTALHQFSALWDELFPAEQARIVTSLVNRGDVRLDGIDITLNTDGLTSLIAEIGYANTENEAA